MTEPTQFSDPSDKNIEPRARAFLDCTQRIKALNKELDEAKKQKEKAEELLIQTLDNATLTQVKVDGVGIFFFKFRFFASIVAEKKSEGYDWIREQGHGDLIEEAVNTKTFRAFIEELIEEDENIELPEFVNTYTKKTIGYRRK